MDIKTHVTAWLTERKVDLFLGYRQVSGHAIPHAFTRDNLNEVADLVSGPERYPLETMARTILADDPHLKLGILTRDCGQRSLTVLSGLGRLKAENLETLPVSCCPSYPDATCSNLHREKTGALKTAIGIDPSWDLATVESMDQKELFARWNYEFQKCIKCYGCRNICPVCICKECSLENPDLVSKGKLPPESPIFHLIKAAHMGGRCIDCGLCEEACPMDIPLRLLIKKVNATTRELFDFIPGKDARTSPLNTIDDGGRLDPAN